MENNNIDYSKNVGKKNSENTFNKKQLLRKIDISPKVRNQLDIQLFNDKAQYNEKTIESANKLLDLLTNEGIVYELKGRHDGSGLLAKTSGLGGNDLNITIAAKDEYRMNYKSKKRELTSSEYLVGNINANGRNYFIDRVPDLKHSFDKYRKDNKINKNHPEWKSLWAKYYSNERVKSFEESKYAYILKGLIGKLPVVTSYNKGNVRQNTTYDNSYTVLNDNNKPIVRFFRRKESNISKNDNSDYLTAYLINKEEDINSVEKTPLLQLIQDTNLDIENSLDENGVVSRDNKGFLEESELKSINLINTSTFEGLNLDTLLAFNKRSDIAKLIRYEMENNEEFDLNNEGIIGEGGLKDLLVEEMAGVNAKEIDVNDMSDSDYLKKEYNRVKSDAEETLHRLGIENTVISFDDNYVLHWEGVNSQDDTKRSGEIGQIFLPNEKGVIETKFKTLNDSENRNYYLVSGYTAYYKNNSEEKVRTPKKITITDEKGNDYEVVASIEKDTLGNNKPFLTNKGGYIRPERLPEEELIRINSEIELFNQDKEDKDKLSKIDSEDKERTLRDRLRLKGYRQNLSQQLDATIARQVLQEENHSVDNTSLNKLYHGDVYGIRIPSNYINKDNIIETYNKRVKFENDVLTLPIKELDSSFEGEEPDYDGEDYSHRFNIKELDGLFDRSMSTDGANLGLIRYLNEDTNILNKTGEVIPGLNPDISRARILDDMPFNEADPGDRSMMGSNQFMKSRNVSKSRVALMTYKGYTFEDGAVISERFALEQGEIVNGLDGQGEPIPLEIGDKISDLHGNKATISYVAKSEDEVFNENPELDVIMNPHSIPSRMNTGVALEMKNNGVIEPIIHEGREIGESGELSVVITDITAKQKTKTYQKQYDNEGNLIANQTFRKGRSFGVQEAWVANALDLENVMKEVYGDNIKPFESLKAYMNVTGLTFDENTAVLLSNGFNNGKKEPDSDVNKVETSETLDLPRDGGYMELPVEIELPSGMKTKYLNVLPEKHRKKQEMFDGDTMYHDYTNKYSKISKSCVKYNDLDEKYKIALTNDLKDIKEHDLMEYDLKTEEDQMRLRKILSNPEDVKEFDKQINKLRNDVNKAETLIQSNVRSLTEQVIDDKLGGHSKLTERLNHFGDHEGYRSKNSKSIKRSIIKKEIMSKEVPNSVTSVVTAAPNVDINCIKVSSDIYDALNLKNEDERVLLWRDPALHDGSMRAFKVEKDDNLTGVGINPLVTESFGMDFDGDTVGIYAPKTKESQLELKEKAALEKNLIDATSKEFSGNIGMDFVSSAYENGYVRDERNEITQGPLFGAEQEIVDKNGEFIKPKDQLQYLLNEMAKEENGHVEINQLWKDVVVDKSNIGTSRIDFSSRDKFYDSVMDMAVKGAKGNPNGIIDEKVKENIDKHKESTGVDLTYRQRMDDPELYIAEQSTVMDYYDRGSEMYELKQKFKDGDEKSLEDYKTLYSPYKKISMENGEVDKVRNKGSLGYDQDKTRMAQSGKTDLTGLAGAKSQTLVSLMYDKDDGAMSAMEVTEPLTQATLKLKHDPNKTPQIKKLLEDYDDMLSKGGYSREEFTSTFKEMYEGVGLDVRQEHLNDVYETLSDKTEATLPIQEVIEQKMTPLMKANLYGYDVLKESASGVEKNKEIAKGQWEKQKLDINREWVSKDINGRDITEGNMSKLKNIAIGNIEPDKVELNTLRQGEKSNYHIPSGIKDLGGGCTKTSAAAFAKENHCGIYKEIKEEKSLEQESKSEYIVNDNSDHAFDDKNDKKKEEIEMEL